LQEALDYFVEEVFDDITQPGLLSMYCEAVGGKPDDTNRVGAALVLLVGAADLHDDLIDGSKIKNQKPTVLGKFGKDITVLAGDALMIEGMLLLQEAVAGFSVKKRKNILESIRQAFFDLSSAEVEEANHKGRNDLTADEYLRIISSKTAVSQATGRIGGLLGNGTEDDVEMMRDMGRVLGLLNTLRDEFIDVYEAEELKNRFVNEVLPLPILYVFRDPAKKEEIMKLLGSRRLSDKKADRILDVVMKASETDELRQFMRSEIEKARRYLPRLKGADALKLLLESSLEDT
jgi:geranylgeranyl diphosphate synthase type I